MNRAISRLCVSTALLSLAACAGGAQSRYPSLAIRDVERVSGSAQPADPEVAEPPAPPVSETLQQQIVRLTAQARQAHEAFASRAGTATRTVAAARGLRSPADGWVQSQLALADLQALRSGAMIALADLDELFAQERLASPGALTPSGQALADARAQVNGWVEEEDAVITRLATNLRT